MSGTVKLDCDDPDALDEPDDPDELEVLKLSPLLAT